MHTFKLQCFSEGIIIGLLMDNFFMDENIQYKAKMRSLLLHSSIRKKACQA